MIIRSIRSFSLLGSRCLTSINSNQKKAFSTHKWIIQSPYKNIMIPDKSFPQFIFDLQEHFTEKVAFVNGMTGESLTHGEFRDKSMKLASALTRLGLQKGDVVAIISPNVTEFMITFVGVAAMGGINTTINCTYTPGEIARQLENSKASVIVVHQAVLHSAREAMKLYPRIKHIISMGSAEDNVLSLHNLLEDNGSAYPHNIKINPVEDLIVLPYSSGTTGLPKGVMLTHTNLIANILQVDHAEDKVMIDATHDFQETCIGLLPMFHAYGLIPCMGLALKLGAKTITLPEFKPQTYIDALVHHKPTFLHVVPPILGFLSQNPDVLKSYLANTHTIRCAAAPIGPTAIEALLKKFDNGLRFQEEYGMTEILITHQSSSKKLVPGSCGPCLPNTIAKVVDAKTGKILGPDDGEGELCVYGPQISKGYYGNEKSTTETIDEDGWLHTGDIVRYDHEQNFFIVDRLKDLIKVKGLQVAPAELEDLLRLHPDVLDVAVIGVPDDRSGELPRAYIVPKNESACPRNISDFIANNVARHKKLDGGVIFVAVIPKSATGKILRKELRAHALAERAEK